MHMIAIYQEANIIYALHFKNLERLYIPWLLSNSDF